MAIGVYFAPASMSTQQYDDIMSRLKAANADKPKGRTYHVAFQEEHGLHVFDIWDSQADFEAFGATLMPILQAAGVDPGQPMITPVHNIVSS